MVQEKLCVESWQLGRAVDKSTQPEVRKTSQKMVVFLRKIENFGR